jgi:uncharacterized membrane protein
MSENIISSINIKKLILSIIILIGLDYIYLNLFSSHFKQQILDVQLSPLEFRLIPAVVCYLTLVFGLNYFILQRDSNVIDAALLGLVIYTVYETTNMVIFKKWNIKSVLIDSIWGGVLYGLTTFIINNIMTIFG